MRGINKLHSIVLPQRSELKLQDVPEEQLVREVYGGPDGLARQRKKERLVKVMEKVADAREQKAAAASATAAATEAVNGAPGAEELRVRSAAPAVVTSVAPPSAMAVSYWSREKATTWGVVAGLRWDSGRHPMLVSCPPDACLRSSCIQHSRGLDSRGPGNRSHRPSTWIRFSAQVGGTRVGNHMCFGRRTGLQVILC